MVAKTRVRGWAMMVAACVGVLASASCIDEDLPDLARVVVEAEADQPLELLVSRNFLVQAATDGPGQEILPLQADTLAVAGGFDQTFDITEFRRIYVVVTNHEAEAEEVRLRVFVDSEEQFDRVQTISGGQFIEFAFTSRAIF